MRRISVAGLVVPLLLVAACVGGGNDAGGADGTVTVVAAASLTDAFGAIATAFEEANPGVVVEVTFDGSARLATALIEGAPADVFASADVDNLARVVDEGLTHGDPVIFATNELQIVVAQGNPLGIDSLEDLTAPDLTLSLCGPQVPCGAYADQAFERAGLDPPSAGDQESVKGVLTQVQLGEADAGIVYVTDVRAAEGVEGVDLAPGEQVEASYPASALADASDADLAAAFVAFLTAAEAQSILADLGFGPP
jgi:molybdate transport system substrate-binding protein